MRSFSSAKLLLIAIRPKTLVAAFIPVLLGTSIAMYADGSVDLVIASVTLLAASSIQVATNLFNDALDFEKGADTQERVGPQRVTQSALVSPTRVKIWASFFLFFAFVCGLYLAWFGGWWIVVIGGFSLVLAYAYTGGPFPLAYHGLGEVFVILFFGLIAVAGTVYLQVSLVPQEAWVAGLQIGLLAAGLIAINNLRDRNQDIIVGKKTLATRVSPYFMRMIIVSFIIWPFLLQLYWVPKIEIYAFFPLISAGLGVSVIRLVLKATGVDWNTALGRLALLHLIYGSTMSLGIILHGL